MKILFLILLIGLILVKSDSFTCDNAKITLTKTDLIGSPRGEWIWQGDSTTQIAFFVTTSNHLYRSFDGGRSWVDQNPLLQGIDNKGVYGLSGVNTISNLAGVGIIITGYTQYVWVSVDQGKTYTRYATPNYQFEITKPHTIVSNYILAQAGTNRCYNFTDPGFCRYDLLLSKDYGKTWEVIDKYVWISYWGLDFNGTDIWYLSQKNTGNQNFYESYDLLSTNLANNNRKLHFDVCKGFLVKNGYYFVAIDSTSNAASLELYTSIDGKNFTKIYFPARDVLAEKRYTILDTQYGATFINVDHSTSNAGWGNLYVSGSMNKNFDISMLFNVRSGGKIDFAKIYSVSGVYIANELEGIVTAQTKQTDTKESKEERKEKEEREREERERKEGGRYRMGEIFDLYSSFSPLSTSLQPINPINGDLKTDTNTVRADTNTIRADSNTVRADGNVVSKISYDNGGNWEKIKVDPSNCVGSNKSEDCYLNLAGKAETTFSDIYTVPEAIGIIIASGNVGSSLTSSKDLLSVWFSRDAGATWQMIRNTTQKFAISDRGAIIMFASDNTLSSTFSYTLDEGLTFNSCDFSSLGAFTISQIFTNPNEGTQEFFIFGRSNSMGGSIIHADFTNIQEKQCVGADSPDTPTSDFETWFPGKENCILGQKIKYVRRKRESKCYIGDGVQTNSVISLCACKREDYECAPCFEENESGDCVPSNSDNLSCPLPPDTSTCTSEDSYYYKTKGYQLVDFDKCQSDSSDIWAPEKIKCGSKTTGSTTGGSGGSHAAAVIGVLFLIISIGIASTFVVLIFLARRDQNGRVHEFLSKYLPQPWITPSQSGYGVLLGNDTEHQFNEDPLEDEESHQPNVLNDNDIDQIFDRKDENNDTTDSEDFNPRGNKN